MTLDRTLFSIKVVQVEGISAAVALHNSDAETAQHNSGRGRNRFHGCHLNFARIKLVNIFPFEIIILMYTTLAYELSEASEKNMRFIFTIRDIFNPRRYLYRIYSLICVNEFFLFKFRRMRNRPNQSYLTICVAFLPL